MGDQVTIRAYRPDDAAAVVALWNRRVAGCYAAAPLTVERFRADVVGKRHFVPDGLCLAFRGGRLAAWAHAGFRAGEGEAPDPRLGTLSMLAVDDGEEESGQAAVGAAVRYLLARGARLVTAFTIDFPSTPFYNGLYGGEKAGMDETHPLGLEVLRRCGFVPAAGALVMTCDLPEEAPAPPALPEGTRLVVVPWPSPFTPDGYGIPEEIRQAEIMDGDGRVLAHMIFWRLDRYNQAGGDRLAVVSHVYAAPESRGSGVAACLQEAVHALLHAEGIRRMGLGTGGASVRAVRFYLKLGYRPLLNAQQFYLDWRRYEEYLP